MKTQKYDKLSHPSVYPQNATTVTLSVKPVTYTMSDEQIFTIHGWLEMHWSDSRLAWDKVRYTGIDSIRLPAEEIWKPDIKLYNSHSDTNEIIDSTNVVIMSDGKVVWVPTVNLPVRCQGSVVWWPREELICKLILGSWTYSEYDIVIKIEDGEKENPFGGSDMAVDDTEVVTREWMMIKDQAGWNMHVESVETHQVVYKCCPEPYDDMTYTLKVRRGGHMEPLLLGLSVMALIGMTLLSCWLPVNDQTKSAPVRLVLLLVPFVCAIILLIHCQMHIPANFDVPIIVRVLLTLVVMDSLGIASLGLNLILMAQSKRQPISDQVQLGVLTKLLLLPTKEEKKDAVPEERLAKIRTYSLVLDRILFLILMLLCIIVIIITCV